METDIKIRNTSRTTADRASTSANTPGTLFFRNVDYAVKTTRESDKGWFHYRSLPYFKATKTKQILFDVSGRFPRGMNAILGPTGCGKSCLLDILAHRIDSRNISGYVRVDGFNHHLLPRNTVGYVLQENIFSDTLTVRENLFFSGNLRLPKTLSRKEINDRVSSVIIELALEHCADTYMGTEFLRGVSGGEKKRTCIGMELILSPKILFLDEPTTGLDASTAHNVMNCLKELSQKGRTIVFSIHQPRYSIFKLFDTVMFMCHGRCIFQGSTKDVIPYFSMHGYQCEVHDNPADFVLDVLIAATRRSETLSKLSNAYVRSTMYKNILALTEEQSTLNTNEKQKRVRHACKVEAAHPMITEIFYISKRTMLNAVRSPEVVLSQVAASLVDGVLVGLVFNNLPKTIAPGIQNRLGAIFFIVVTQIFSGVSALEPFLKERVLFLHEYANDYYRISSYFIAKVACDVLLMRVISSIIFSIITYFMMGFNRTADHFFIYLLTIFMAIVFGSSISFAVSAAISTLGKLIFFVVILNRFYQYQYVIKQVFAEIKFDMLIREILLLFFVLSAISRFFKNTTVDAVIVAVIYLISPLL